ncbi:MAG: family 20 glycosylhydrolase [Clostridia bacterium]|nr:family 20 glycosylhydrolase [Clostridia bacterium]
MKNKLKNLLPTPIKTELRDGVFTASAIPAALETAQSLASYLLGNAINTESTSEPLFTLSLSDCGGDGAYVIDIDEKITVTATDEQGAMSALQTLKSISSPAECGLLFPCCHIEDAPYKPVRGVHLYLPPVYMIDEFFTLLDTLASMKYNTIILEIGGCVQLDRHPEINMAWLKFCHEAHDYPTGPQGIQGSEAYWKDSTHVEISGGGLISKADLRRIVDHCRLLGLNLVPELQSLSHAYYLTLAHPEIAERPHERWPDHYCPSNDKSYELYFEVAEELLEVIEPTQVHIGHDEVRVLGECPLCREKSGHELLAGDINRLYNFYNARGIKIMMWGEMVQNFTSWKGMPTGGVEHNHVDKYGRKYHLPTTYEAAHMIPKDILMFDWYYSMADGTQDEFREKGFTEIYGNFRGSQIANWDKRSKSPNVIGGEVSTWCIPSEYEIGFNGWFYELAFSAKVLWQNDFCDEKRGEFSRIAEEYMPTIMEKLSGKRAFDGTADTLGQMSVKAGEKKNITYRYGTIDKAVADEIAAGGLTPLGEGEKLSLDGEAEKIVFFHAVNGQPKDRLTTWAFMDKRPRIPAKYVVDYDDGMAKTVLVEFGATEHSGVAIGDKHSTDKYVRPDAYGNMLNDIDDANVVNEEKLTLSPMYAPVDNWRAAAIYSCRFAEFDTPDGIRTVYSCEWENPYPGHKITGVRYINEPFSPLEAELYAVAIVK